MQRCAANGAVAAKRDGLLAQSIRAEAAAESPSYGMTMKKAIAKYKISPQIIQQKHMQKQQADDTKNNRILWAVPGRGTQRRNFCDIGDQQEKGNGGHRKRHAPRKVAHLDSAAMRSIGSVDTRYSSAVISMVQVTPLALWVIVDSDIKINS